MSWARSGRQNTEQRRNWQGMGFGFAGPGQAINPVIPGIPRTAIDLVAREASINYSTASGVTTRWADAGDHSVTFGTAPSGNWRWDYNINFFFGMPTSGKFDIGFLGATVTSTLSILIELIDGSGATLLQATRYGDFTWSMGAVVQSTYDYSLVFDEGIEIAEFNGIRFTFANSDTNIQYALPGEFLTGSVEWLPNHQFREFNL